MEGPYGRQRSASPRPGLLVLTIAAFVGLSAALSAPLAPLFDPDEGYYPATAAETLRSGPFWDLRFNNAPRWDKPILSYAFIEAAFVVIGESVTAARLPSAVEGAALTAIVGLIASRLAGRRAGVLSALVVGSSFGLGVFSRAAHPEIGVVTSVVTTQLLLCVWETTTERRAQRLATLGIGVALGLGVLMKGPVAIVLPGLTLCGLALTRQWSREHATRFVADAALSLTVAAALLVPWYGVMTAHHGVAFLREAVWQQNVGRYTTTSFGHRGSGLLVWLSAVVGLFPWLTLLPQALRRVSLRPIHPRELLRTGMCVSACSALVFYSLSSSKLPSYALVAVPSLAVVVGLWLDDVWETPQALRRSWILSASLLAGLGVALVTVHLWIGRIAQPRQLFGGNRPPGLDTGAILMPVTVATGCLLLLGALILGVSKGPALRTLTLAVLGASFPEVALMSGAPILREMYPWAALGHRVERRYGPVWLMSRRAPSLTFYAHDDVHVAPNLQALALEVRRQPHCWLVVTSEEWSQLSTNLGAEGSVLEQHGRMVLVRIAPSR